MKESDIKWENVKEFKKDKVISIKKHRFVFDKGQESNNDIYIKYSILKYTTIDEEYYQRIVELPFACKSSWTKTEPKEQSIITLIESSLRQKYKDILTRNYNNIEYFKKFKKTIGEDNIARDKYISKLYHGSSLETINNQHIGNIWKKLYPPPSYTYNLYVLDTDFSDDILSWNKFVNMLIQDSCSYCGISIEQINKISRRKELYTKRSRGYTLEVDQKDPNKGYHDDNCVSCCYWCNNAKTDEFSVKDFQEIAKGINITWNKRLGSKEGFNSMIKFPFDTYKESS